jgi:cyclin-dependent kinase regulatory subunit CKS1
MNTSKSISTAKNPVKKRVDSGFRIHYSDRYTDDAYEYRHVILPKQLLRLVPKHFFNEESGTLRLLSEPEWRGIGITQSLGWEHYEVHGVWHRALCRVYESLKSDGIAPEPHVLLFRRPKDFVPPPQHATSKATRRR